MLYICFSLSDLLHSVWQTLGPSMSLQPVPQGRKMAVTMPLVKHFPLPSPVTVITRGVQVCKCGTEYHSESRFGIRLQRSQYSTHCRETLGRLYNHINFSILVYTIGITICTVGFYWRLNAIVCVESARSSTYSALRQIAGLQTFLMGWAITYKKENHQNKRKHYPDT